MGEVGTIRAWALVKVSESGDGIVCLPARHDSGEKLIRLAELFGAAHQAGSESRTFARTDARGRKVGSFPPVKVRYLDVPAVTDDTRRTWERFLGHTLPEDDAQAAKLVEHSMRRFA